MSMESWLMPMLCATADEVPEGPEWVIEGKLDGWRFVCHRTGEGVRAFAGRNGSNYTGQVPYIETALMDLLPPDSAVDGELIGRTWGDVQSVMTRTGGAHRPVRGLPALTYVIFDVTRLGGQDLRQWSWDMRRVALEATFDAVEANTHLSLNPYGEASEAAHVAMLDAGLEGSVFKRRDARYVNSRSPQWAKLKAKETCEARVIGFKAGKVGTRWAGKVGAFTVQLLDEPQATTTVKCGTDARHNEAHEHPDRWLDAVIEITHLGLGAEGVPRSPNFLRRREDRETAPVAKTTTIRRPRMAASPRNYGAMKDEKLLKVMRELTHGGDAAQRALAKGFDPADDLERVEGLARDRGLIA
jgi:ATP-dependent DNA ligase